MPVLHRICCQRLETMALFASDIPIQAIRKQIASSIDIIVQLERLRDRSRRVTAIAEVLDCTEDAYILNPIFEFHEQDNLVMESSSYGDIPERVVGSTGANRLSFDAQA